MLRFVRALDGEIAFDEKAIAPSRGAWICATRLCLTKAFDKRLLFRKEKVLPINSKEILEQVTKRLKLSLLGNLGMLRRFGHCEVGRDAVKSSMLSQNMAMVLYASDFSQRSLKEIQENSRRFDWQVPIVKVPVSMDELGNCLGREKTGVVALNKSRITEEILMKLNKLASVSQ